MFGFFYSAKPGVRLAWMPLKYPAPPMMQDILYYTGDSQAPWSPDVESATVLFPHTNTYTHLSAMWLRDARKWIILYSKANDESGLAGYPLPVVARIGSSLLDWSEEIEIFNPIDQGAYTRYMHKVGSGDGIHPNIPPAEDTRVRPEHDGWAYGAFILSRYTTWRENTGELDLHYLLSLSSPYQVQMMHSRLMFA